MKKSLSLILAIAMVFTMFASVAFAADETAAPATTVTETTYTPEQAFEALKAAGIVEGDPVKGADLEGNMTRAQFAKVISLLFSLPANEAASSIYTDLVGAGWAKGFIGAASTPTATLPQLLNGMGGGKFNPSGNVKLEEIAKVIATAFKLPVVNYSGNGKVSTWAKGYVGAVISAKLVADSADFTKPAKRSELFTIGYTGYKAIEAATKPSPSPTPAAKGLDLASAVALNSKVVEVTLGTAAVAADLAAVGAVTAKTGTTDLVVSSVAAAPYNTDGKVVLVTLAADTTVGTLYTLTSGTKSVNFGGQPVDTTAPTVSSIAVNDYNEIEITFSEPVQLAGAVITAAESYGTKVVLATSDFAYNGNTTIKVMTGDQKASTLYSLAISAVKDFAGNTIVADNAKTFVGIAKPTAANTLGTIAPWDSKTIKVPFALKVDGTTSLDKSKYSVALTYGTKEAIEVTAVALDAADATGKTVVLTLATDTVAQLYTVTVAAGVTTKYGVATTAALTGTFVGIIADVIALPAPVAASTSNTKITLTFGNSEVADAVAADTKADQFAITEAYGSKAALAINGISVAKNVVTLTTAAQSGVLYNVVSKTGLKDAKGNATTADLTSTFVGKLVAAALTNITSATLDATGTLLTVVFDGNVGATATDISHYTIDNSIGYPSKAVKTNDNTVTLTVPKTTQSKLYILTVKGLENADGVAMAAAGITESFSGKGLGVTNPAIQAIIANDAQTITIYFDRAIADTKITGPILNGTALVAGALKYSTDGTNPTIDLATGAYAWVDPANANALKVRLNSEAFKTATAGSVLKLLGDPTKVTNTVALDFAPNPTAATKPSISAVIANNSTALTVYFSEDVAGVDMNDFKVSANANGTGTIALVNKVVKLDSKTYQVGLDTALLSQSYYLIVADAVVDVTANDTVSTITSISNSNLELTANNPSAVAADFNSTQFAGTSTAVGKITSAQVIMTNKKTFEIYFPVAMDEATAKNEDNYKLYATATGGTELSGGTSWFDANVVVTAFDAATNKVTFTTDTLLPTSTTYYVEFAVGIKNAILNSNVQTSATDATPLRVQLAASSLAAPMVTVTSVTYATYDITINLNQDITTTITTGTDVVTNFTITINSGAHTIVAGDVSNVVQTAGKLVVTITKPVTANGIGTVAPKAAVTGINGEAGDPAANSSFTQ